MVPSAPFRSRGKLRSGAGDRAGDPGPFSPRPREPPELGLLQLLALERLILVYCSPSSAALRHSSWPLLRPCAHPAPPARGQGAHLGTMSRLGTCLVTLIGVSVIPWRGTSQAGPRLQGPGARGPEGALDTGSSGVDIERRTARPGRGHGRESTVLSPRRGSGAGGEGGHLTLGPAERRSPGAGQGVRLPYPGPAPPRPGRVSREDGATRVPGRLREQQQKNFA